MRTVLVTGSSGLLGSACVRHFGAISDRVYGFDGNQRRDYFGDDGDTTLSRQRLLREVERFIPMAGDIRFLSHLLKVFESIRPDVVIHCAAQPSHDFATRQPVLDYETNALGTLNVLEATRLMAPHAVVCFASTNKVYGDSVNRLPRVEHERRYNFAPDTPAGRWGVGEWLDLDQSRHSIFGASKLAADVLVQEYAHTFGLKTGCFRFGCLTGASHAGAELHGFLAYLARCCRTGRHYTVYGHQGKQVRDQLHAADAARAFELFAAEPRPGAVYNLGGGFENSVSVLEAIDAIQAATGKPLNLRHDDTARGGDHVVYWTDNGKFRRDYPWSVSIALDDIIEELCQQP